MADRHLPKNPKAYKAMEMIAKGRTQSDVADRLNVSQSTVSSWKRQIEQGPCPGQNISVRDERRVAVIEPDRIIIAEQTRSINMSGAGSRHRRY